MNAGAPLTKTTAAGQTPLQLAVAQEQDAAALLLLAARAYTCHDGALIHALGRRLLERRSEFFQRPPLHCCYCSESCKTMPGLRRHL